MFVLISHFVAEFCIDAFGRPPLTNLNKRFLTDGRAKAPKPWRLEMMLNRVLAIGVAVAALSASAAHAVDYLYTSQAAFNAHSINDTTYNFSSVSNLTFSNVGTSYTDGPVTVGSNGFLALVGSLGSSANYGVAFISSQYFGTSPLTTTLNLPGTTAVGIDYGSYINTNDTLIFTLNDGSTFSRNLPTTVSTQAFAGFTSLLPITKVTIVDNASAGTVGTDFLTFTLGTAVPEPALWATMMIGLGGLGAVLRSRRRTAVATI